MDSSSDFSESSQHTWSPGESNFSSDSDSEQPSASSSQGHDQNILTAQKIESNKRDYYDIVSGVDDERKTCKVSDCQKTFATLNNLIRHCKSAHKRIAKHAIEINKASYAKETRSVKCKICEETFTYENISRHLQDVHVKELRVKTDKPKVKSVVKDETQVPKYNSRDLAPRQIETIVSEFIDFLGLTAKSPKTIDQYSREVRKILQFWVSKGFLAKPYSMWSPKTVQEVPTINDYLKNRVGVSSKRSAIWSYKKVSLYFIHFNNLIVGSTIRVLILIF